MEVSVYAFHALGFGDNQTSILVILSQWLNWVLRYMLRILLHMISYIFDIYHASILYKLKLNLMSILGL